MVNMMDLSSKVDFSIVSKGFWKVEMEDKKILVDLELKNYAWHKISEMNITVPEEELKQLSMHELLTILASRIPEEEHFNTLRYFTHYILSLIGNLQSWSIVWWQEDDEELKNNPSICMNEENLWTDLKTHEKTNYIQTFDFVYDIFQNQFMKNNFKQLGIRYPGELAYPYSQKEV